MAEDNKKRILIVNDTEDIAFFLYFILKKYGDTDIAYNGQQALIKSALYHYDLLISDFDIPVMDGIEFYKAVAESYPDINSHFLFFASSYDRQYMDFIIENNVPLLHKPAPIEDIEKAVSKILNNSYASRSEANGSEEKNLVKGVINNYGERISNEASCC